MNSVVLALVFVTTAFDSARSSHWNRAAEPMHAEKGVDPTSVTVTKCKECNGSKECRFCLGKGQYDCTKCNGTGEIDGDKCPRCNGRGNFSCEKCNGTGKCPHCRGTGEEPQHNLSGGGCSNANALGDLILSTERTLP